MLVRCGDEGAELQGKAVCLLLYIPPLTCDQELWVLTERMRSQIQVDVMTFLHSVTGLSLRDWVRSLENKWEGLEIEPLLLHNKRSQ